MNRSLPLKRVLITGAGGFVGTSLCHYLPEWGDYQLIGAVRRHADVLARQFPHCDWITWDVTTTRGEPVPEVDAIIHLATANNILCEREPSTALNVAVTGTENVVRLAMRNPSTRLIHVSTIQVYGTELSGLIDETTPARPENRYALYHRFAEEVVELAHRQGRIQGTVVRLANGFGRYLGPTVERWTLVPACFCREAHRSGQLTLRSSGLQRRNFVPMRDVAYAVHCLLQAEAPPPLVNVASAQTYRVLDAARWVREEYEGRTGRTAPLRIESDEPREDNAFEISLKRLFSSGYGVQYDNLEHALKREIRLIMDDLELNSKTAGQGVAG